MTDLIIKGGTVIDPSNNLHEKRDIAIEDGRIQDIESRISDGNSQVLDASGMYVTPGLIDIHAHVAKDLIHLGIDADTYCLKNGTTTAVDAGSCGELNFTPLKKFVLSISKTRLFAFLNIESLGMIEFSESGGGNTNEQWPELLWTEKERYAPMFVNLEATTKMIKSNRDIIVGLKWAHHGLSVLKLARKAADVTGTKVMAECRYAPESLGFLKKGDVSTHIFHEARHRISGRIDGISEDGKSIHPEVFEASKRGVILDVGHGMGSFSWKIARLALNEQIEPDTISTDLWSANVHGPVFDLPTTMEKFLHLGMSLDNIIGAATTVPAKVLKKEKEIGTLNPGSEADLFLFKMHSGKKVLMDSYAKSEVADQSIAACYVIKHGAIIGRS